MKAAILETRGRDGLFIRDVPVPERKPGEVLLRVHAAGLNRVDLYMRDNGAGITHTLPQTLGVECAGTVVEADADSGLRAGQKAAVYSNAFCGTCRYCLAGDQPLCLRAHIMGEHRNGAFADYVVMPARCVLPLPDNADLVGAGALLAAYLTAWRMLFGKRTLRPGETVLIVGIGGGVAVACLQLARHAGARVLELTGGEGVDMVIDSVGQSSWDDSIRSLRRGGRIVTCGATTGSHPSADLRRLFIRQLEVYGSTGGSMEECRQLLALFASGALKPVIDKRYTLDELPAAFDRLEHGEQFGKIVVTMGEVPA